MEFAPEFEFAIQELLAMVNYASANYDKLLTLNVVVIPSVWCMARK